MDTQPEKMMVVFLIAWFLFLAVSAASDSGYRKESTLAATVLTESPSVAH